MLVSFPFVVYPLVGCLNHIEALLLILNFKIKVLKTLCMVFHTLYKFIIPLVVSSFVFLIKILTGVR
jgi:hypothetical protein